MATSTPTNAWTVADLSALYVEHRKSLTSQARRMLRDEADATEVVQEAFMKFILAAPELDSADRALAYLRTFDIQRKQKQAANRCKASGW